ncbi:hypothetical protein V6N11_016867 [Hibiscus sabdariffa]|uniref:Uncharacterized protein n=1 Tax=Hibiscus sabdariffa TaxID=183260 RepID=A0ABR2TWL9_9ROSI
MPPLISYSGDRSHCTEGNIALVQADAFTPRPTVIGDEGGVKLSGKGLQETELEGFILVRSGAFSLFGHGCSPTKTKDFHC